jgi:hypothetical protein
MEREEGLRDADRCEPLEDGPRRFTEIRDEMVDQPEGHHADAARAQTFTASSSAAPTPRSRPDEYELTPARGNTPRTAWRDPRLGGRHIHEIIAARERRDRAHNQ